MVLESNLLAKRLPDLPRWVEARALLRWGRCRIYGSAQVPELAFIVRDLATGLIVVVGEPAPEAIRAAAAEPPFECVVVAPWEKRAHVTHALPDWQVSRAILHQLRDPRRLPEVPVASVRFLGADALESQHHLPDELREELKIGAEQSPIAATLVDGRAVSFCYAGAITESLWDISIDTLPEHRRRGYAALCVTHMIRHMQAQGKEPVWGAVEQNAASWRLAQKLGFVPVDELVLLEQAVLDAPDITHAEAE